MPNLPPLPGVDAQTFLREREANHFVRERHDLNAAPAVTLPELYEVPWRSLREAYGPAYFVPYYVSALSSPDQEDRNWGLEALWASINHQGHPGEASPHVVPFLLALLDAPQLPDRQIVLGFTIELAVGEARWCYEAGSDVDGFHRTACYGAVATGAEIIGRHLGHEDASVRAEALRGCGLVAALDRFIDTVQDLARHDRDRGVRLTARIALGCMARRMGRDVAAWLRRHESSEDRWERAVHVAALAYALGGGRSRSRVAAGARWLDANGRGSCVRGGGRPRGSSRELGVGCRQLAAAPVRHGFGAAQSPTASNVATSTSFRIGECCPNSTVTRPCACGALV